MKRVALFLEGRYPQKHFKYYKSLTKNTICIAVDGGMRFFKRAKIEPDIWIGDMDSLRSPSFSPQTKVIKHPVHKDKTDSHLAFEYALKLTPQQIDLVTPVVGQLDHFLGNMSLVDLLPKISKVRVIIRNHDYECTYICNSKINFSDCVGDRISVMPWKSKVNLYNKGMLYPATDIKLQPGETIGLRNKIKAKRASVEIIGSAWVIHYFA